jgi:hypothetical protein
MRPVVLAHTPPHKKEEMGQLCLGLGRKRIAGDYRAEAVALEPGQGHGARAVASGDREAVGQQAPCPLLPQ